MTSLSLRIAIADDDRSLIDECAVMEPDVIITDNLMPGISGAAAAAAIIYERRPVPIILLSAFCDPELVIDAERKHVLMYMVKPLSEAHLEVALNRCRKERNVQKCDGTEEEIVLKYPSGESSGTTSHSRTAPLQSPRGPRG